MLMPIMASLGAALSIAPLLLMVPVAIAASCAFMMPVATPPNAIVFGSGNVSIQQMAKTGFFLNLLFIAIVTAIGFWVVPMLWS
jgi:sodium-dependent dicarboxylate transporter 2/3/5